MDKSHLTLNNGVTMSPIGLGTWNMKDPQDILRALQNGYRMIDTATLYQNESAVGEAIRKSRIDRRELFVVTKLHVDDQGYQSTFDAYQASLDRLGLDYVDLYMIHTPTGDEMAYIDSWKAMEKLYRDKKVRAIGVSNFWPAQLETLARRCTIKPTVNQIKLHTYMQQRATSQYCRDHQIAVQSYSPLARADQIFDDPTLSTIADRHHKTIPQIILRWHIQSGFVPIPKSNDSSRQQENLAIFNFELSDDDMATIASLDRQPKVA